jgi:hypothetical protein
MELDLDSFLNSPPTSDDDDDDNVDDGHNFNSVPHHTIDEILNASNSSTSSASSLLSPPSIHTCFSDPKQDQEDAVSISTIKPSSKFSIFETTTIRPAQSDETPSLQLGVISV